MENDKFREVLIFVAGTTPQIITETIYGLIHQKPPVYPDEIHIITTTHGKNLIEENLIKVGRFKQFCKEFNLKDDILNKDSIVVVKDGKGDELDDIKTDADNETLGNFITNFIRERARGVPEVIKIDNLKAAILEANFYGPIYQRMYKEFSDYYGFKPIPCRIYHPNDKGKVESGIKYVKSNFFLGRRFKSRAVIFSDTKKR